MRPFVLGCSLAIALTSSAAAEPGAWQVQIKTSALDGAEEYSAGVLSDAPVNGRRNRLQNATLGLLCDRNGMALTIAWPDRLAPSLAEDEELLTWKLDSGPIQKTLWSSGKKGVALLGARGLDMAHKWSAGTTLVVRVPDMHGGQEAIFQIAGLDQIVDHISRAGCG